MNNNKGRDGDDLDLLGELGTKAVGRDKSEGEK